MVPSQDFSIGGGITINKEPLTPPKAELVEDTGGTK